ncbi:MAG: N(4)-(beta-N-acetylglucosaminyl)-L-asparaginase, partial [Erysipelotrichia bacterium]|nr:N(4)-(beta-N-acetylglucosaminyl)-L-asparaginase [Erysipelotrichia bacterium]
MWAMIATWRMALEGIMKAERLLNEHGEGAQALLTAVKEVENNPYFKSVGYGGLPNREGTVELDAGFMNGNTMGVGAVCGVHDIANPIAVAESLSHREVNAVLTSKGAELYAREYGFEIKNMKTERAEIIYENRLKQTAETELTPYNGHDTVGVCLVDSSSSVYAGTSTSGLFMKDPGRLGDSPIVGSGFYADSETGAASATGLGEDMMRGCISYEIVRRMKEGKPVQQACDEA